MRALVIEDEVKTAAYLRQGLSENGFTVEVCSNGDDGLHQALAVENDLIILDVMLPERDGWSVLAALRKAGKQTPVLFLTARDTVHDKVKGLELGADDYLVKPFDFAELLARVRTILRRSPVRQAEVLRSERAKLLHSLAGLAGVKPFPSEANMILVRVPDSKRAFDGMKARGVLVKNIAGLHPLLANCLRLTVGTPEENVLMMDALKASL